MNKRIKELAVQAKIPEYNLEYGTELCIAPHLEKFAELILHDVLSQNILQAQRVDKDPVRQNYPKEVIAGFFYGDMMKLYGVEE